MYKLRTDETLDRSLIKSIKKTDKVQNIVEKCIHNIIVCLGDNPNRSGLQKTPNRVYRMYKEIFAGMDKSNEEIAKDNNVCFDDASGDLVTVCDIPIFSTCEHHLASMVNMKVHVGYIPNGKVIGLSKIARIADICGKRLQLQERIGTDIADILKMILDTEDIIVVVEGEHLCMSMRGIKKPGTITRTAAIRGKFQTDSDLRKEFYSLVLHN